MDVSSGKSGSASDSGRRQRVENPTSCFEPLEGVLALLSELAMLEEPRLRLFDGSLNLGIAMNAEVTVRDEIWNNNGVRCGGSVGDDFWSRDRSGFRFGDLDDDRLVNLRASTRQRPKPMEDPGGAILEPLGHRPYPERSRGGSFLGRHLGRNGEEPGSSENKLS